MRACYPVGDKSYNRGRVDQPTTRDSFHSRIDKNRPRALEIIRVAVVLGFSRGKFPKTRLLASAWNLVWRGLNSLRKIAGTRA
jgi:hypothetical protein